MAGKHPKNWTRGIAPAHDGALGVLQHTLHGLDIEEEGPATEVQDAANEVARYHAPVGDQAARHEALAATLAAFLVDIVRYAPPGPERSTAISRAREAKFWASAAVALEPR